MNEDEWRVSTDPGAMLEFMSGRVSDRKLRLFAVECCRMVWHILTDDRSRRAVELAERSADGPIPERELDAASGEAEEAFGEAIIDDGDDEREDNPGVTSARFAAACSAASYASNTPVVRVEDALWVVDATCDAVPDSSVLRSNQAAILRDIVGNPFRAVDPCPAWSTPAVLALARGVYDDRAFEQMPVLADLLEDAGCDDGRILNHCRTEGPHARGCWVLDLILEKG